MPSPSSRRRSSISLIRWRCPQAPVSGRAEPTGPPKWARCARRWFRRVEHFRMPRPRSPESPMFHRFHLAGTSGTTVCHGRPAAAAVPRQPGCPRSKSPGRCIGGGCPGGRRASWTGRQSVGSQAGSRQSEEVGEAGGGCGSGSAAPLPGDPVPGLLPGYRWYLLGLPPAARSTPVPPRAVPTRTPPWGARRASVPIRPASRPVSRGAPAARRRPRRRKRPVARRTLVG